LLVKDETKYCWVDGEIVGEPQGSIKEAIADCLEYYSNLCGVGYSDHSYLGECSDIGVINIGHPSYYEADVNGEQVIWQVVDDAESFLEDSCYSYLDLVKDEHLNELSQELSEVFRKWEKRHKYENRAYVVVNTEQYRIGDYINRNW